MMQGLEDGGEMHGTVDKAEYTYTYDYIENGTLHTTVWGTFTLTSETTLVANDAGVVKNSDGQIIHEETSSWIGIKQ